MSDTIIEAVADIYIPKKNVIFDATVLSSLMNCGRFYDLRYNYRFVQMGGKGNSLECGSIAHKVLEVFTKHQINGFPRSTCIAQGLTAGILYVNGCPGCADPSTVAPSCGHEPGEYPGVQNTPEENERVGSGGLKVGWRWVLQTMEQYFEFYKNDSFIPLAAEEVRTTPDNSPLYEDEDIRVYWKAKFDKIIDTNQIGIVPMDHKTHKQNRSKSSLNNQFIGQTLLLGARSIIIDKIGWQTSLKPAEKFIREVISYSEDRQKEWRNEILPYYAYKYIEHTESGYWPPNFTSCQTMYGDCPYKGVCESNRNMREEILRNEFIVGPVWDPTNKLEEA